MGTSGGEEAEEEEEEEERWACPDPADGSSQNLLIFWRRGERRLHGGWRLVSVESMVRSFPVSLSNVRGTENRKSIIPVSLTGDTGR